MALQLILGGSGQGKTEYLKQEVIRESVANPDRKYYVLVPEQFSLEMQRQMVEAHPRHGFSNIDILSFHRLAYRVFDECGYEPREILEDLGVSMILKRVLLEHEGELPYFRRSLHHPGFLDELKSMLMELISYGVDASDLINTAEILSSHPGLRDKCEEIGKICQWFDENIRDHFMVAGRILDVLKDMVSDSSLLRDGIFYLDGYTGFTPVQLAFLRKLLPHAGEVKITVTIPYIPGNGKKHPSEDLFSFSEKTVRSLWNLCRESGTPMEDPILLEEEIPFRYGSCRDLAHLEQNMFRNRKKVFKGPVDNIHMVSCANPEEEAEYVLHKIEELVRTRGYRYLDFAILMGNEEDYPSAFLRRTDYLDIPLFVDTRQKMVYHSGVETIRALFHLAEMDYSYQSVFRYLKSGMSDFSGEEADYLEDYVYSSGVRGSSMWKKPFTRRLQGLSEDKITRLDSLRIKFWEETFPFVLEMKKEESTVKQKMNVLYETLCRLSFREKLNRKAEEAENRSEYEKAKGYQQFYARLLELMDKIVAVFGEECIPADELAAVFDAGLDSLTLSVPPLAMDQVILGDLKRTRLPEIKILFFVGMNDGDMPPVPEEKGILNDEEKRILEEHGIRLSLNLTEQVLENEFYMYLAFSRPRNGLYLSCCQTGADGNARKPSSLFHDLCRLYPALSLMRYPEEIKRYYFNEADSREYLLEQMRRWYDGQRPEDPAFYALFRYWQEEHPEELREIWERMDAGKIWKDLPAELADKLYGKELTGSVTRMEAFSTCPFLFFCTYGLHLSEREEFEVHPVDLGNLFHGALEYFSRQVKERGFHWKDIPEEVQQELLEESVNAAMEESIRDVIDSTARNQYKRKMVLRILTRTVKVLRYHLRNSSFEPDRFELSFSVRDALEKTKIRLADGHRIAFQGVIDRVDICEDGDRLYLKIIDYKSGTRKFDFNELYYGLQLQLVMYLNAAMEIYGRERQKPVEPAGIFYYHIQDPIQKEADVENEKGMDIYRMSGYVNSDPEIRECLEHGGGSMISFPLTVNKSGDLRKGSSAMTTGDFLRVGDYVRDTMARLGTRIYAGEIAPVPYQTGDRVPCTYCAYVSVCGYEQDDPHQKYRILEKQSNEEILERIREEVE